jgi:uncharacterized membrane protein
MTPIDATRPWMLFTLLGLALVAWLARSTRLHLPPGRFWTSTTARFLAVASLALALSGVRWVRISEELAVVFVLDRSRSISAEESRRALDWVRETAKGAGAKESVGLVAFGREASVEASPGPGLDVDKIRSVVSPDGTDIACAIRLAAAACPDGAQKRIVLLTDGNENAGDAGAEALAARARGAEVWTVPLGRADATEVRVERVHVPPRLSPKEPYEITVIVTSSSDVEATFRILKNRQPLEPVTRPLKKGTWPVTFTHKVSEDEAGSALDFEVQIAVPDGADTWRENNVGLGHARVQGPPRILYLEGKSGEEEALAGCLRDAGLAVDVKGPAGAPLSLAEMDAYDAILLCDIHSRQLSKGQHEALRQYVHSLGGGLVMIGGDGSFGAGVWQDTAVEKALPVYADVRHFKHLASLAMVIVIDSSGSMSAQTADGRTKLALAGEAAAEVVRAMNARDELGVATVDTAVTWVQKLAPIRDKKGMANEVSSLQQGGGGIYCNIALRAADEEIRKAKSSMRHVVLFSDSADSEEKEGCEPIVERWVRDGITCSVVAIGNPTDGDAPWLESIARLGNGRYYITNDAMDLPRIFSEEAVLAARSVLVEEEFEPLFLRPAQMMDGIDWALAPKLRGYVATVPKERAEVHLEGLNGDPLLAKWQYGLGRSVAFTSDAKPRWALHWVNWPGYRALWPQLVRWVMRRPDPGAFSVAASASAGRARVSVDAVGANGRFRDFLKLRAYVAGPAATSLELPLKQTGPGRYEAVFDAADTGSWFVTIAEEEPGGWTPRSGVPILIPYPAEFRASAPDRALLSRIAAGSGGVAAEIGPLPDLFRHTAPPARIPREIWREFLFAAIALLFVDVLARRLGIPTSWLRRAVRAPAPKSAEEALVGRLREVKAEVAEKRLPRPAAEVAPAEWTATVREGDEAPPPPAAPPAASAEAPPATPEEQSAYLQRLKEAKKKAQR